MFTGCSDLPPPTLGQSLRQFKTSPPWAPLFKDEKARLHMFNVVAAQRAREDGETIAKVYFNAHLEYTATIPQPPDCGAVPPRYCGPRSAGSKEDLFGYIRFRALEGRWGPDGIALGERPPE